MSKCVKFNPNTRKHCQALTEDDNCVNCPFFKDIAQVDLDRKKAYTRLKDLGLLEYYYQKYGRTFYMSVLKGR